MPPALLRARRNIRRKILSKKKGRLKPDSSCPGLPLSNRIYVWMFRPRGATGRWHGRAHGHRPSKARRYDQEKDTRVTLDDVAGIDEAKIELVEIVDFLRDPKSTPAWRTVRKACC